jgi:hypothetical protein
MTDMPHQIITRAIGATVSVLTIRDPADGTSRHVVSYECGITHWVSRHLFQDVAQAEAGCLTLADFLGAEMRR